MRATWRPLAAWPYPPRPRGTSTFRTDWARSLDKLEYEIERAGGDDVVIGIVVGPDAISFSGALRAGGRTKVGHPGIEVSFDRDGRRVVFHTDAYGSAHANIHAIALGLEALRAVDRYGITSGDEQWAGFAALPCGGPDPERGRVLVERAGGITAALKAHHPDHGGEARDFADVQAYRERSAVAS